MTGLNNIKHEIKIVLDIPNTIEVSSYYKSITGRYYCDSKVIQVPEYIMDAINLNQLSVIKMCKKYE